MKYSAELIHYASVCFCNELALFAANRGKVCIGSVYAIYNIESVNYYCHERVSFGTFLSIFPKQCLHSSGKIEPNKHRYSYNNSIMDNNIEDDISAFMDERFLYKDSQIYMMENSIGEFYIGSTWCYKLSDRMDRHQKDFELNFTGLSKKKCSAANLFLHIPVSIRLIESGKWKSEEMFRKEANYISEHKENPLCVNIAMPYVSKEDQASARRLRENVKVTCECGSCISVGNLSSHKKTKKHLAYVVAAADVAV